MASPTLGFSLTAADRERIGRLADRYAGGNRSLWLRQAIELYEERALLDMLADLQDRGDQLTAGRRLDRDLIADVVAESAAAPYSVHADRVSRLVADFLGDAGFDDAPVDTEATARFLTGTDAAWHAYRADEQVPLVVLDATLLATATAFAGSSYRSWPDIPPTTSNAEADCISVIASSPRHGNDFGLVVSERLLRQVADTLRSSVGLRPRDIDDYLLALLHFARRSGGEIVEDRPSSTMLPAHLDIPLSLAQQKQAVLVAAHPALRALQDRGPEWGPDRIALIGPREFSVRADAARRARRA